MKPSLVRVAIFVLLILVAGLFVLVRFAPETVPEPVRAAIAPGSGLKSFEFLGCSGGWMEEEIAPQVWRVGNTSGTSLLVRHAATCGYTKGTGAHAFVSGSAIELEYTLDNDAGVLAACYCEYWARFEPKSLPEDVESVTINGEQARLMGDLARTHGID